MTDDLPLLLGTRSAEIAMRIRRDIIGGTFAFGSRLTLGQLEARYECGQMPIREALRQLQGEGLVEMAPNRGARVRQVDVDFVRNLFDVRVAIETMLTRRAAERVRRADIDRLEQAAMGFERATGEPLAELLAANRHFHGLINDIAGNGEATEILRRNEQLMTALWLRHGYGVERIAASSADHRMILAALRAGDADSAACFAQAHAAKAKLDLLGRMQAAGAGA
jgi:DNA-binding GntR family transcriptional regulator